MAYINLGPKKPRKDFRKKERQAVYNTKRWKELRTLKLMLNCLCEECEKMDKVTVATEVHHKDSFMKYQGIEREEKAFDIDNLESLCSDCHKKEHGKKDSEFRF
nr:HNH endonuclease signature motif containing protein [uncultured Bacteroides sp.]